MKKMMIAIGLVVVAAALYAQQVPSDLAGKTYYYRYVQTVDPRTEVRSLNRLIWARGTDQTPTEVYLTFTRDGCFTSDEKGVSKYTSYIGFTQPGTSNTFIPYSYQGEQNNMLVFRIYYNNTSYGVGGIYTRYLSFSKDYKRMNFSASHVSVNTGDDGEFIVQNIFVYEQANPSQPAPQPATPAGPDRMW